MATQTYDRGAFFFNSGAVLESTDIDVEHDSGAQAVTTQQKGFAGMSPGAETTKITVGNAIPAAGYENDYLSAMQNLDIVECTLFAASKKMTVKGYVTNIKKKFGVGNPSSVSFDVMAGPAKESTL